VHEYRQVYESERGVFVEHRNVAVVGWREAPEVADIRAWHRLGQTMTREHGKCACIDIVLRGTPRFSDEVRRASEELARDPKIFELGFAHAMLMPGLGGSAVRAFIGTILLVTRPPVPAKVLGDVSAAVEWLLPKLGGAWTAQELRAVCEHVVVQLNVGGPKPTA
jgi:hypothetical protein